MKSRIQTNRISNIQTNRCKERNRNEKLPSAPRTFKHYFLATKRLKQRHFIQWPRCGVVTKFFFEDFVPLWARITKNTVWSTGPLAHPFARSLTLLSRSLAPHYSLPSRSAALRCAHSLARLLTVLTPSLMGKWMIR